MSVFIWWLFDRNRFGGVGSSNLEQPFPLYNSPEIRRNHSHCLKFYIFTMYDCERMHQVAWNGHEKGSFKFVTPPRVNFNLQNDLTSGDFHHGNRPLGVSPVFEVHVRTAFGKSVLKKQKLVTDVCDYWSRHSQPWPGNNTGRYTLEV